MGNSDDVKLENQYPEIMSSSLSRGIGEFTRLVILGLHRIN